MKKKKSSKLATTPLKRDPEGTRARILECATPCFARGGFKGTSLSTILDKARVNKRMVYHYFGNKAGLYRAVHIQEWQALEAWFGKALVESSQAGAFGLESEELLLEALAIFHEFVSRHQYFVRLMMWDGLEGGTVSRSIWNDIRGPIYQQIEALVLRAQEQGVISKDLMANHLVVSFMGAVSFYFAYAPSLEDIFKRPTLTPEAIAERRLQTLALFQKVMTIPKNV